MLRHRFVWSLLLVALLAPAVPVAAEAPADEVIVVHRFAGTFVAVPFFEGRDPIDRETILTFDVPDDAKKVYLRVAEVYRAPVEVVVGFDVFLESPTGSASAATTNGMGVGTRSCFVPDVECTFTEPEGMQSRFLPNAPGEWRLSYRGMFHGDYLLEVRVVR